MELSFSKKAKLEALDNMKYPKEICCKENFIRGYFFNDVKLGDFTELIVQPDIVKSTKIVKKLLSDLEIDSYGVTREKETGKQTARMYITEEESIQKMHSIQRKRIVCDKCAVAFMTGLFIKNGTVSDPTKEYQLEFSVSDEDKAAKLLAGFYRLGFVFKMVQRRKNYVV